MPCNSDYLNATGAEIEDGQLLLVHDEVIDGKRIDPEKWESAGYDKRVYGDTLTKAMRDKLVSEICTALRKNGKGRSLEVQMWWRDHQRADAKREREEREASETEKTKRSGLSKLSAAERRALDL